MAGLRWQPHASHCAVEDTDEFASYHLLEPMNLQPCTLKHPSAYNLAPPSYPRDPGDTLCECPKINKIEVNIFKILKILTHFVTTTINDQSNETTTGNMVQHASIQDKNDNEVNDETEGSRQLLMQSFDDSLR